MTSPEKTRIHATSISWHGRAALLLGPSGSGKSSTALRMMALGCDLVADDQCDVSFEDGGLRVSCPPQISGRIEARNFGILKCAPAISAKLVCAVDLSIVEEKRLPEVHTMTICGQSLRVFHNPGIEALPFALLQYLKSSIIPLEVDGPAHER